ncbi:hypothetical protein KKB18_03595, partial [bacterium]|nr:hypothetical protein [bacterium]
LLPNNLIALYWDDLWPTYDGGNVFYETFGKEPDRYLVVEWYDVYYGEKDPPGTFEVILFEGTNEIKFQYLDVDLGYPEFDWGASATVGLESNGGTLAAEYSCNEPVLTNEMAILFQICTTTNSITLESFDTEPSFDGVIVNWKTGTEIDNLGYYIVRSESPDKGYILVNKDVIPAKGNVYSGSTYEYMDRSAAFGHVYYYWLVDVDIYGAMKVHGPSKVVTYLDK